MFIKITIIQQEILKKFKKIIVVINKILKLKIKFLNILNYKDLRILKVF